MGWLFLMALLYIAGALLYAARIPERFFPGKCDLVVSNIMTLFFVFSVALLLSVSIPSDFPSLRGRCCLCPLPRHQVSHY